MSNYDLFFVIVLLIVLGLICILFAVLVDSKLASKRYKKLAEQLKKDGFKDE